MTHTVNLVPYGGKYSTSVAADVLVGTTIASAVQLLSTASMDPVELVFHLLTNTDNSGSEMDGRLRTVTDEFYRCVDRALLRVYPSIDPCVVLSRPVEFGVEEDTHVFFSRLTVTAVDSMGQSYTVNGEAVTPLRSPKEAEEKAQKAEEWNEADAELWRRARAANAKVDEEVDEEQQARMVKLGIRLSRFCAERITNESNWAKVADSKARGAKRPREGDLSSSLHTLPLFKDVLDAAKGQKEKRRVAHADGRGIQFDAVIVGHMDQFCYIAVPSRRADGGQTASSLYLLAKLPKLDDVPDSSTTSVSFSPPLENVSNVIPFRRLESLQRWREWPIVTVRAHRVQAIADATSTPQIVFEEVFIMAKKGTLKPKGEDVASQVGNTLGDVYTLIRQSCTRFLADRLRYSEVLKDSSSSGGDPEVAVVREMDEFYEKLRDMSSVHFKKMRGKRKKQGGIPVPEVRTCRDIAALVEGPTVEFKQRVSVVTIPEEEEEEADRGATKGYNVERLRNVIAGMASLHGGVILIGVADDGTVVGHPRGEVVPHLRTSAYCPAMVKDAVTLLELRVTNGEGMPAEWWKKPSTTLSTVKKGKGAAEEEEERVVTVISVEPGQAPFYRSNPRVPPYVRWCASTMPIPTTVLASRIRRALGKEG